MSNKMDFFEDLSESLDYWVGTTVTSITDETADLVWVRNEAAFKRLQNLLVDKGISEDVESVLKECVQGLAHSFLCILDGATQMSSKGRIYLVDAHGSSLGEGLHEEFEEFLYDKGKFD
ncbi:hypothetical protein ACN9MY_15030 [Pseudoduganella sp. R-31]|uniref:hypothetical protein n=1 Tax=Pseudoduganella sp. R-31 TaxID=3404060 RepID=UPI003CF72372